MSAHRGKMHAARRTAQGVVHSFAAVQQCRALVVPGRSPAWHHPAPTSPASTGPTPLPTYPAPAHTPRSADDDGAAGGSHLPTTYPLPPYHTTHNYFAARGPGRGSATLAPAVKDGQAGDEGDLSRTSPFSNACFCIPLPENLYVGVVFYSATLDRQPAFLPAPHRHYSPKLARALPLLHQQLWAVGCGAVRYRCGAGVTDLPSPYLTPPTPR